MTDRISHLSIDALHDGYRRGDLSVVEVARATLERIEQLDGELRSFTSIDPDLVMIQAERAQAEIVSGTVRSPMHGVPVSFKDLIDVGGLHTTGSSRVYQGRKPIRDAPVVARLRKAGAIILGVNTAYEFGLGLPMDGDWPEPARNPWGLDRIPGGSSSGSAVSVYSGLSWASLGTDTGGSIRGPAAYCGVVGLKPSYGKISAKGVFALSQTLDHVGPMARTLQDTAHMLSGSSDGKLRRLDEGVAARSMVGVPRKLVDFAVLTGDVRKAYEDTLALLEDLGSDLVEVEMPAIDITEKALLTIIGSEGYSSHREKLTTVPELFGPSARERLGSGIKHTGADYVDALAFKAEAVRHMDRVFRKVDFIVSPVTHTTAATFEDYARAPTPRTLFTGIYNLVGAPSVSVPCTTDRDGMPIGFLVSGPRGRDTAVLSFGLPVEAEFSRRAELTPSARRFTS